MEQGGEFEGHINDKCDELGIDVAVPASHAATQHGLAERHGGLLGTIFRNVCFQHVVAGESAVSQALALCCQAKNSVMTRNRQSAEQAVFRRSLRFTELSNTDADDGEEVLVSVLGTHGPAWRASHIRTAAKLHLLQCDACHKVRRAMLRKAPIALGDLCPDSRIYLFGTCGQPGPQTRGPREMDGDLRLWLPDKEATVTTLPTEPRASWWRVSRCVMLRAWKRWQLTTWRGIWIWCRKTVKTFSRHRGRIRAPLVDPSRSAPKLVLRDTDVDMAVPPLANIDPASLRSIRTASKCTECGRFGHLSGDTECPMQTSSERQVVGAPIPEPPASSTRSSVH